MWIDDHGGWSYTTVLATAIGPIAPHAANAESTEVRWWDKAEIDALPLHHGLAAIWPQLRPSRLPLAIVVDTRADLSLAAYWDRQTTGASTRSTGSCGTAFRCWTCPSG